MSNKKKPKMNNRYIYIYIGFESKQFPNFGTLIDKTKILVPNLKQSIPEALFTIGGGWREKESNDLRKPKVLGVDESFLQL